MAPKKYPGRFKPETADERTRHNKQDRESN
jgi:hypothetical protein